MTKALVFHIIKKKLKDRKMKHDLTEGECIPTDSEALNILNLVFQFSER